jgi:hypothetical protein
MSCVLRQSYVFNPSDNWMQVKLASNSDIHSIPVIPPRSTRRFPATLKDPRIAEQRPLTPDEIKRYAPDISVPPVVLQPIDLKIAGIWPGTMSLDGESHQVQVPLRIDSDKLLGAIALTGVRIVLIGQVSVRLHTVALTAYWASDDLRTANSAAFVASCLKKEDDVVTFSGENPSTRMSFAITIDTANPPSFPPFPLAAQVTGAYFAFFVSERSQTEWEGTTMSCYENGLVTGRAREGTHQVEFWGLANPLFVAIRKGTSIGYCSGAVLLDGGAVAMEGSWRQPGSEHVGRFNFLTMAQ